MNVKKNTLRNYEFVLDNFQKHFGEKELSSITSEDILDFMSKISDGAKPNTKKLRFTLLSAFFNFVKNSLDPQFNNPCDNPQLRKLFRAVKAVPLNLVIGLGNFGMSLARTLSEEMQRSWLVDINKNLGEEAADFVTEAIVRDATDEEELAGLEPGKRDSAVCAIGDDSKEASIICTVLLRQMGASLVIFPRQ
jgi:hypothetical protein